MPQQVEALLAIGAASAILGAALFTVGGLYAKRWVTAHPTNGAARNVSWPGLVGCGIFIVVMISGLASSVYAPESDFSTFIDTRVGFFAWLGFSMIMNFISAFICERFRVAALKLESERDV
jgi:hypothetical protein